MSFAATPLGQGSRRLDHSTFLGKTAPNPPSPRLVPTSYAYGAPLRSPPKSPARERNNIADENDSALARFAKIKRELDLGNRPGGPKVISSPPHPEKWSVKDTTVNIATAFHQAAADMPPTNPNSAWASGATRTNTVPRSTSVEYENQSQSTASRRLAPPPSRISNSSRSTIRTKPLSKSSSLQQIPDSEGEDEPSQNGRGKSPFNALLDAGSKALQAATYYARAASREPENRAANTSNGNDSSYEAAEKEFQAIRKAATSHKRNRMSTDNKAYKPSHSDLEVSDEDYDDDDKTRRKKKKKKEPLGGPLNTLPVVSQDKRRKKRKADSKGNLQSDNEGETDDNISVQQRGSVPPQHDPDTSYDPEQTLPSIEEENMDVDVDVDPPPSTREGLGAAMGSVVFHITRNAIKTTSWLCSSLLYIVGRLFGTLFDLILLRPKQIVVGPAGKYLIIALIVFGAWCFRDPVVSRLPFSTGRYRAPEVPAANIAELNARLLKIETVLSTLASDAEKAKTRIDSESKNHAEFVGRLSTLESKIQKDSARSADAEAQLRESTSKGFYAVKQEVEQLQAQLQASRQQPSSGKSEGIGSDEEARTKLKALEERVGSIEGGVKDVVEMSKTSAKADAGLAWWNKALSNKKAVTIKSSDGQDVTALIGRLVETAVSAYGKDDLARPDFALHSSGARVIPHLTTSTYELRPQNIRSQVVGLVTGNGYAIGRPPVTALHHELHNGHCWPFAGTQGQLGIALAAPVYISDITIDHVAKEVAFDMRSAPKQMEVWGLVEGKDNIVKVKEWMSEKAERRAEALERGETVEIEEYPKSLPRSPQYIRIASFSYDIHAPDHIQTFPVLPEVQELGVDFGIVVLRMLSNWGRDEFTCLYRVRVHGTRMGETPLPSVEELA